jgi:hypothetical protein
VGTSLVQPSQGQAAQTVLQLMKASLISKIIKLPLVLSWRESKEGKAYNCGTSRLLGRFVYKIDFLLSFVLKPSHVRLGILS